MGKNYVRASVSVCVLHVREWREREGGEGGEAGDRRPRMHTHTQTKLKQEMQKNRATTQTRCVSSRGNFSLWVGVVVSGTETKRRAESGEQRERDGRTNVRLSKAIPETNMTTS